MPRVRSLTGIPQRVHGWGGTVPPFGEIDVPDWVAARLVYGGRVAVIAGPADVFDKNGRLKVHLVAPVSYADGYGSVTLDVVPVLDELLCLKLTPLYGADPRTAPADVLGVAERQDYNFPVIGMLLGLPTSLGVLGERVRIIMSMWETTDYRGACPSWTRLVNSVDGLIVPSRFCFDVFESCGVRVPIYTVPLSGGRWAYQSDWTPPDTGKFTVVSWANMGPRKNVAGMIQAFTVAFPPAKFDHCRLIIKSTARSYRHWYGRLPAHDRRVSWVFEDWTPEQMIEFAMQAHVMLFLSHGEGSGKPPREAMAVGMPVICARNTGMEEICANGHVYAVDSRRMDDAPQGGMWAVPDLEQAAQYLLAVHDDYASAVRRGRLSMEWIRSTLTPAVTGNGIAKILSGYATLAEETRERVHNVRFDPDLADAVAATVLAAGITSVYVVGPNDIPMRQWCDRISTHGIRVDQESTVLVDFHRLEHHTYGGGEIVNVRRAVIGQLSEFDTVIIVVPSQFYSQGLVGDEIIHPIRNWRGGLSDGTFTVRVRYAGGHSGNEYVIVVATRKGGCA